MDQPDVFGLLYVPVTITLDGPDSAPIVMELDGEHGIGGGQHIELTADQARAIAADLETMADEA